MQIKNIIFDLGGVIIDLDYNNTAQAFKDLGVDDFDNIYSKKKQDSLFDDFEKGKLSIPDFRADIRQYLNNKVTDEQIDAAWNSMLLKVPAERMAFLKTLSKKYRIFLLSNTNAIHVKAFTKIVDSAFGENAFTKTFEKVYYSCSLNMRKPDKEIFELVMNENNLSKEETIFIDDSVQHIEGAKAAGLTAYLLDKNDTIEKMLPGILKI